MVGSTQPGLIISALMTESLWKEFEKTGENRIMTKDHGHQSVPTDVQNHHPYLASNFAVLQLDTEQMPLKQPAYVRWKVATHHSVPG